jgi:hypothetical protein
MCLWTLILKETDTASDSETSVHTRELPLCRQRMQAQDQSLLQTLDWFYQQIDANDPFACGRDKHSPRIQSIKLPTAHWCWTQSSHLIDDKWMLSEGSQPTKKILVFEPGPTTNIQPVSQAYAEAPMEVPGAGCFLTSEARL